MKILFVTNEVPYPPDNGVRIVSYNAMRLMNDAGHELSLAVLTEETDNLSERFDKIKSLCKIGQSFLLKLTVRNRWFILAGSLFHNRIYPIERYNSHLFRSNLKKLIDDFKPDVIHFDIITMTQYRDIVPKGVGTVASINDSYCLTLQNLFLSDQYKGVQYAYRKLQYYQTRLYERSMYEKFDKIHVMSQIDGDFLTSLSRNISASVVPNGVSSQLFEIAGESFDKTDIIFVAKLVGENISSLEKFLRICWPEVHVGKVGDEAVELKNKYDGRGGIIFSGYVEDLSSVYSKCGVSIVPINKSCGLINKAIEAMASGLAVVGFNKTF